MIRMKVWTNRQIAMGVCFVLLTLFLITELVIRSRVVHNGIDLEAADKFNSFRKKSLNKKEVNYITELPNIEPHSCIRCFLNEPPRYNVDWTMCLKSPVEAISNVILTTGHWEIESEKNMLEMVRNYPDGVFLDIGSNIGPFVTMIAATQHKVIAVDPYIVNLAYIRRSTDLHGTSERVQLIQNAVNDEKIHLYPWVQISTNEGYVVFLTEEEAKSKPQHQIGMPVSSVTFQEILDTIEEKTVILKIDIEGAECKVLTSYLQNDQKNKFIPFIFMEWRHVGINNFGLCPDVQSLLQGFEKSGYYPSTISLPNPTRLKPANHEEWDDVLWIHKDAIIG